MRTLTRLKLGQVAYYWNAHNSDIDRRRLITVGSRRTRGHEARPSVSVLVTSVEHGTEQAVALTRSSKPRARREKWP
jgi:hypothetical protein